MRSSNGVVAQNGAPELMHYPKKDNKPSGNGIFFSKPWSERPWWSRWHDIIAVAVVGVILLIVIWDSLGRWWGH